MYDAPTRFSPSRRVWASTKPLTWASVFPLGLTDGFALEVYDFVTAIRDGRPPEVDGEAGMMAKAKWAAARIPARRETRWYTNPSKP